MDTRAFLDTLPVMAKGMAGIFIVTGIIILTTALLNRFTVSKEKNDKE